MKLEELTKKRRNHVKSCQDNKDHSHNVIADLYSSRSHFIILNTLVQNYALSVQGFSCYTFLELDIVQNLTVRKSRLSNILKFGIG